MKNLCLVVLLSCLFFIHSAYAGPADKVFTPAIGYGESEIGFKYGSSAPIAGNGAQVASLGFGHGVREYWFTEISLKRARYGAQGVSLAEWENKFLLTEAGKSALVIGLITELEMPLSGNAPWEIRFGPLLQTAFGKFQLNGNLLFERAFGRPDENGVPFSTNLAYQWQAKYRWRPALEFGVQGMGEMGKWNNWSRQAEQNHRIGPALFGEFALGDGQALKYNAAWLAKASAAAPHHTFRMSIEYEF